jgi:NitT/TauT family transport system permease protein
VVTNSPAALDAVSSRPPPRLRGEISTEVGFLWGVAGILSVLSVWYLVTAPIFPVPMDAEASQGERAAEAESDDGIERLPLVSPVLLPSPGAVFQAVPSVFRERKLIPNAVVSLKRVVLGFGLSAVIGVPIGVAAACFPAVRSYFAPMTIFGRNIPVAALIPLTFSLFGIGELQKVMFLFIASVAFVIGDATSAVMAVPQRYVDTALTLGASRLQIILKVLVPLAAPSIFNSLRLLFGLAFGYVMLSELVKLGGDAGGLGDLIMTSQRRNQREPILIVLIVIPILAYAIDRMLWWLQCDLFPYRYGGRGHLPRLVHRVLHGKGTAAAEPNGMETA